MNLVAREGDYLFPNDVYSMTDAEWDEVCRELVRQFGQEQFNSFFSEIARQNALTQQKSDHTDIFLPCTHEIAEQINISTEGEGTINAGKTGQNGANSGSRTRAGITVVDGSVSAA